MPLDDAPEPLVDGMVDLGAIATEFLISGHRPLSAQAGCGVRGAPPPAMSAAHPFAALAALKKGRGGKTEVRICPLLRIRTPTRYCSTPCPIKSASRSTPWGATMGPRWSFPAPNCRSPVIPTSNSCCSATAPIVEPLLAARPRLKAASPLVHTDVAVQMDDKPSQALRKGRWKSSMWLAIDAVKKGEADVAVSAGNTGALMAMAKIQPEDHGRDRAPGDRGALADAEGPIDRARSRRLDRRRRRASRRSRGHGQRHGAQCCSVSTGRPSGCSISGSRR